MDQEGGIRISTAPDWAPAQPGSRRTGQMPQAWRDHWKQCWAPVPSRLTVAGGHKLQVDLASAVCKRTSRAATHIYSEDHMKLN